MKGKLIKRIMIASLLVSSFAIAPIGSAYANAEPNKEEQKAENAKEKEQDKKEKEETKEVQEPENETPKNIGDPPSGENVVGKEKEVEIDIDTPASVTGERMEGNGTVVDFSTTGSRAFYTIVDNDQQVFYLIIDMDKTDNNVYFLSDINRAELDGATTANQNDQANVAPTPPADVEQPEQEVQSETETSDNNMGFLFTVLILGLVGAVGYYFLVVKKKQNKNTSEDDDEMTEDYDDDFEEDYYDDEEETENSQEK